ncbi:MAG TPA: PilZ domain-containing protein [Candidatus Acidoferrales bacterium]|nr:PilZ domain-containing protein [Candidatus Acidoferrales bacterium]
MPTEQRQHRRAHVRIPVRLRWLGPLGQLLEVSETLDVSRGGLLVRSENECYSGAPLWVTFPYDSSLSSNLPETPARILRVERRDGNTQVVAVRLEPPVSLNGSAPRPPIERRNSRRAPISIPVALRSFSSPWAEETMSLDISCKGIRLTTFREYVEGEKVVVRFQRDAPVSDWPVGREVPARVVRMVPIPGSSQWHMALHRLS